MKTMSKWKAVAFASVLGLGAVAVAGGDFKKGELLQRFDKNGDGQLDEAEKQALRAEKQARRAEKLAKYDVNKDGTLDDAERQKARADRAAERFKALDTDGNGSLSLAEFQAGMGEGKRRHGRR